MREFAGCRQVRFLDRSICFFFFFPSRSRFDLGFWYDSAFGSPVGRAQGIGYVQELVARLTKTPIATVRG